MVSGAGAGPLTGELTEEQIKALPTYDFDIAQVGVAAPPFTYAVTEASIADYCKAIRNDQGYWQQVDAFMRDHSNAQLTHAICPDCSERLLLDVR